MLKTEAAELIRHGESSGVEFKRDDVRPEQLAREMVALLNLEGGHIFLGVEDDGAVSGLVRDNAEEWVMQVSRDHIQPAIIPYWEAIEWEDGRRIGIVSLPSDSPDKPYKGKRGSFWVTYVRVGTTSREATREEEARLYQASGLMRYELKKVPGSSLDDLDLDRLTHYFRSIRDQEVPPASDPEAWEQLLVNTDLMLEERNRAVPNVASLLLFGENAKRLLPQSGISAAAYPGAEKDYAARERANLRGPLVSLQSETGEILERGVIDQAVNFVVRNTVPKAWLEEGRRQESWDYPTEAVRETIVNAVAHRDYSITVVDIELSIYEDRLEVISPGRLPNTVTVEKMRHGYRATRNELVKEVLRDYRYIEATGLGVPRKIIRGMREHNGTEPDLIADDERFIVRLHKI